MGSKERDCGQELISGHHISCQFQQLILGGNKNISIYLLQTYVHRQWLLLTIIMVTATSFSYNIKCIHFFVLL